MPIVSLKYDDYHSFQLLDTLWVGINEINIISKWTVKKTVKYLQNMQNLTLKNISYLGYSRGKDE